MVNCWRRFLGADRPIELVQMLPWLIGWGACLYLVLGFIRADLVSSLQAGNWIKGAYVESYVATSLLLYATVICFILRLLRIERKCWWQGFPAVACFSLLTLFFIQVFMHKLLGWIIWPLYRY